MADVKVAKPANPMRQREIVKATELINSLLRVVLWLIKNGVFVTGFNGAKNDDGENRVTVTIAASPFLHELFRANCFNRQQRQTGCLTIYTWCAIRHGIVIEWEETCAYPHF